MTRQDVQHQTCPLGNCLNKPLNSTPLSQYDASPIRYRTNTPPPPISQPLVMGQYQPQLPLLNPVYQTHHISEPYFIIQSLIVYQSNVYFLILIDFLLNLTLNHRKN